MPTLYIVPTPIGNLEDISLRAITILKKVDVILAEDTRKTGKLLKHYGITTKMISHHKFNEHSEVNRLIGRLSEGKTMALVSDAGTPGISDPGYLLIRSCIQHHIPVSCLPGATALIPALVNSGIPGDRFCFEGFLPQKKGRKSRLEEIAARKLTTILYESPFRLLKTLQQLAEYCGTDRRISISREISKLYEETLHGSLEEMILHFSANPVKGEFVIVVEGTP